MESEQRCLGTDPVFACCSGAVKVVENKQVSCICLAVVSNQLGVMGV